MVAGSGTIGAVLERRFDALEERLKDYVYAAVGEATANLADVGRAQLDGALNAFAEGLVETLRTLLAATVADIEAATKHFTNPGQVEIERQERPALALQRAQVRQQILELQRVETDAGKKLEHLAFGSPDRHLWDANTRVLAWQLEEERKVARRRIEALEMYL
jgi:hypothetical protein